MRNLKKILALALVFAMALTFTAGAADFTDKADIGASYVDDVNMLVELGVIGGYPDGSFGPQKNITRAEFSKMAYTLKYGSDTNGDLFAAQKSIFTDVEGNANVKWAKGYINYCANQKIVSGVGNNKFNPNGNITVAEAAKMILVIMGCDPAKEGFTGANWASNVTSKAIELGVFAGWAGDPTALATRELVAKLMKNAVFAPVYAYSAITGTGSQLNALGTEYNKTLGETTMGLKSVTGIVVANENYYITNDEEGDPIQVPVYDNNGNVVRYSPLVSGATGVDSEESIIYYQAKDKNGNILEKTLIIDRALPDSMIGNKVNVFFTADTSSSAEYDYKNVEVIGDVLVNNDTVAYDVMAMNVSLYPDGEDVGSSAVTPYLAFETEDGTIKITADSQYGRFAKAVDIQDAQQQNTANITGRTYKYDSDNDGVLDATANYTVADVIADFASIAYISNETARGEDLDFLRPANVSSAFFQDMGKASLSAYRFVSVDGGKTYSYIFKMVSDTGAVSGNANYSYVTNYSEAKGSITIAGLGTFDLAEVEVADGIKADDRVVYFRENGVLYVEAVEAINGAVEVINDNGTAVIGGETYALWQYAYAANSSLNLNVGDTLSDYYVSNSAAMGEDTTYYVYGNIVLDIEAAEAAAVVEDYAVILRSSYDEDLDVAYVTLAFADNTEGTYKVSKLNLEDRKNVYNQYNDKAADFANNAYFGMVVKFKLSDAGVDLSGNDFGAIVKNEKQNGKNYDAYDRYKYASTRWNATGAINSASVKEGTVKVNNSTYYAANDGAVLFVLYGNPQYNTSTKVMNRDNKWSAVKAYAYKIVNKAQQSMAAVPAMYQYDAVQDTTVFSYVLNTTKGLNKGIVAAAMTVGDETGDDTGDAAKTNAFAYVVASAMRYNVETQEYYLEMTLIDENGLFTAKTVDSVKDLTNTELTIFSNPYIGKVTGAFGAGTFVEYAKDAEGVITTLDDRWYNARSTTAAASIGLYLVNAVYERSGSLFFINANAPYAGTNAIQTAPIDSLKFAEDGYDVITIDDADYIGESIGFVSAREENLFANKGNAWIQVDRAGEIVRVFSFVTPVNY